jgi:hypothetical protein
MSSATSINSAQGKAAQLTQEPHNGLSSFQSNLLLTHEEVGLTPTFTDILMTPTITHILSIVSTFLRTTDTVYMQFGSNFALGNNGVIFYMQCRIRICKFVGSIVFDSATKDPEDRRSFFRLLNLTKNFNLINN